MKTNLSTSIRILAALLIMASSASANLLISVDGIVDPPDSTVYAIPSDTLSLGIYNTAEGTDGYWVLYCKTSYGSISGGIVLAPKPDPNAGSGFYFLDDDAVGVGLVPLDAGYNGVWGGAFNYMFSNPPVLVPVGMLFDEISFHCESEQDVTIILQEVTNYWEMGVVFDTQIVHVPEPVSALLMICGVGLLRLQNRNR